MPLRRSRGKQICLLSLPCGAGWHATTSCFFTRWFVRLTHTTRFYIDNMLTIRGLTNPTSSCHLKDVVKICWQSNISKGHSQGVFTQCVHRMKSLCRREEITVFVGNSVLQSRVIMPTLEFCRARWSFQIYLFKTVWLMTPLVFELERAKFK